MARKNSSKKALTYAEAGVDIEAGDAVVGRIKSHMRKTYGPRVLGQHGAFAGCFRLDYNEKLFKRNYKDPVLVSGTDGVGTKVLLAIDLKVYDTIGQDCVAMNVNDMIVQGAEPLFFLDYVGIHKVVPEQMEQIVKGVADGCHLAGCALLGGETAEMADVYKPGDFDLAGFSVGVAELSKVVDGSRVEEGDIILGLTSSGIHSNGYTLVRKIIEHANLDIRTIYPELDKERTLGQILLEPTRIYSKSICSVLRSYKRKQPIGGMAHITGGGLPGNVNRALPNNLDALINKKSWDVPPIFKFLKKHGNVKPAEMFRVFNMGIGYTMIVRPHFADAIMDKLKRKGETVMKIGEIVKGSGKVQLK
ncbi:Phosphoribosylformylglycinamidine cyclo-ligase [Poriferisphaera corsica]|uniref:Phosphoribosylformylglycinamidine cyclo-ligase n=1 Tax=Poriferisphaera corsica TaxID=2528020 RepID=A0A517YR11_9BACT|nr:phosphoribosylformylglycinamidine cyclo-ligase [Poriferisphaera corsica]QDU32658.1 Phosphoribosylformylglycinamidine cyclo-ligase [Poriferisphaera corsica]